ncbi:MAG: DUF2207 domain-containing protein [Actinomycetia bacterium]|nr:DUF2207 domain-containing protein [Actinomycetes bacterium]
MKDKTAQLLAVIIGIALIVIYSVVMMATEGNSGWSWILLIIGIVFLIGGGQMLRRSKPT